MMKLRLLFLSLAAGLGMIGAQAQIGYQIALLNTATGEARANETVNVSVSLSNNEGQVFYTETKSATTNDFGILSLSIGNADTFKNVDLTKMPFFIEVTANGVMIGKSQMLSVPVAEVAKQLAPIDKSMIVGTWIVPSYETGRTIVTFNSDNSGVLHYEDNVNGAGWVSYDDDDPIIWDVSGDLIYTYSAGSQSVNLWFIKNGKLYACH